MIELVAFLGNPGKEYAQNRHNAGRLLAETLPFSASLHWQRKYKGLYASIEGSMLLAYQQEAPVPVFQQETLISGKIHLLLPETYMNCSGDSVYAVASFFKIPLGNILVVHDELELPLGTAAYKFSGGLGGHNGLRSMKANFASGDFWRFRLGIGRPPQGDVDIANWVLSDFSPEEQLVFAQVLDTCTKALIQGLVHGPESLLPEWNKKQIP
ncbi:MAG: aminoacyl-tRNA hydrolase [Treponema sp.]|jgi:PTH1 family peptidyl-tRNA hydrolase|nr:aminoacyl-tRNA hydrolase [Treponema sp.]